MPFHATTRYDTRGGGVMMMMQSCVLLQRGISTSTGSGGDRYIYQNRRYYTKTDGSSSSSMHHPPWRRWSAKLPDMGASLHIQQQQQHKAGRLPPRRGLPIMVHPNRVKIALGDIDGIDMDDFTLAVTETVPFAYKYHHPSNRSRRVPDDNILKRVSSRVEERLPDLTDTQLIKILLAFDRIRPKLIHRAAHPQRYFLSRPLAYINQPFMTSLYQAIRPTSINNTKVLLALFTAYARSAIDHPQWIRSVMDHACDTWLPNTPPSPRELADIALALSSTRVKNHDRFLHILTDEIEDNFDQFDEDAIGDVVRAFLSMRYGNEQFFEVLGRELPHRIHEYRWWNLIDIAELYVKLKWPAEKDPDMILRFGNEVWKYHRVMNGKYVARALRVLAFLETSDRRTFRSLIRRIPHHIINLSPTLLAQTITAAAIVGHNPTKMYCRVRGSVLYQRLCRRLSRRVHEVGPHDLAQAVYSLMMVGSRQEYFFEQIVLCIMDDPLRFHLQQLAAFARAFKTLNFVPSVDILSLFADKTQLRGCSIDALATVAALGLGDLQNAALDILTSGVDDNIYTKPEGRYDDDDALATAAINECSCDDIMLILRGVRNNEEQADRVRVAFERYWLPLHYDTITAEEFSWLIWDMASITSSNDSMKNIPTNGVVDDDVDVTTHTRTTAGTVVKDNNKADVLLESLLDRVIDDLTTEQCIRVLAAMIWLQVVGRGGEGGGERYWHKLLPRITHSLLPNQNQSTSRTLIVILSVYLRLLPLHQLPSSHGRVPNDVIELCKWVDDTQGSYFIEDDVDDSVVHLNDDDDTIINSDYTQSSFNGMDWSPSPPGVMRFLRCYPFILPLALVNTAIIDIQKLHRARSFPQVRRILLCNTYHHNDAEDIDNNNNDDDDSNSRSSSFSSGICLIPHTMVPPDVKGRLTLECLRLLGWDVRIMSSDHEARDATAVQEALQQYSTATPVNPSSNVSVTCRS